MTCNLSRMLVVAALTAAGGCGQLAPERTAPGPAPALAAVAPDVSPHAGQTYSEFVAAAGASYSPDALGIPAADRVRLWRGMAEATPSALLTGGGAEALVFRGCSEQGCEEGVSIVAIDVATGVAFAGVRDVGGADVLAPNERVEALLRLNSPTRAWDNPEAAQP
ncbi:hypothetical protein [Terricaulis silvestris]|uniref:Inhibitor of vertebrate lysozyme n=1 Tax=Terricaulis silvestris TaxID=2686094 RepID=A0A6I6MPE4_9CAUL|nr:hypothetical protein [Terricaulis silvestris]QGZ95248.1 hypothetical protein DSM104635_02093 [Terricaulis silvestris]